MSQRPWLIVALLLFACSAFSAVSSGLPSEAQLHEMLKVPSGAKVVYRGLDGRQLSFQDFMAEMSGAGGKLGTSPVTESATGAVTLQLRKVEEPVTESGAITQLPPLDLVDLAGRRIRNADLGARPTLISFFFQECVPCIKEVPLLNAYSRKHPEYNYLAVTFNTVEEAQAFVVQRKLEWPVVADGQRFIDAVGVKAYPAYMLVATDGRILGRGSGMELEAINDVGIGVAHFEAWVKEHLATR